MITTPPPYIGITGIYTTVSKHKDVSKTEYDGSSRPGQLVVDTSNYSLWIGNAQGNLNSVGGANTGNWTFSGDYATTGSEELGIDGTLLVNTIEGTGAAGVTRLLLQASGNGNAYVSIPTDAASTTNNLVIGNEARGVDVVGAFLLDSSGVQNPNISGGSNVTPTNIPLTLGYAILNEGSGGLGYFNLPNGQEGQIIHLVMGTTVSLLASQIHVIMDRGRYIFDAEGGGQQVFRGALDVQPFTEIPTAMVTMMYAGGYWTVTHGTVTQD